MKKGQSGFEKLLHMLIAVTGFYIIYRGSGILAETGALRRLFGSSQTAEVMQEAVVSAYLPGYRAALQPVSESSARLLWIQDLFPVLQNLQETEWEDEAQMTEPEDTGDRQEKEEPPENTEWEEPSTEEDGEEEKTWETETNDQAEQSETEQYEMTERQSEMTETEIEEAEMTMAEGSTLLRPEELGDFSYLLNHYFVVDSDTSVDETTLDAAAMLAEDLSMEKKEEPQILIYHTHSQEAFLDSVEGDPQTSIVGIGGYLATLLEGYGYQVIHDEGVYDLVDGVLDRNAAYDYARASVEQILEEYPSIEVVIDLHRDGVEDYHFVTEENGKSTAQIMFFNGLSMNSAGQAISYLYNPYIKENLAFSFQLQLAAQERYPGFTRNIYLKGQRFNLHLRPRSLLIEAGSQLNTVEEEKNAMEPLADILNQVLSGKNRTYLSD